MRTELYWELVCFMYLHLLYAIFSSHPDWEWKHKFAYEIQSLIVETTLKTKAPSYDTILKVSVFRTYLDRLRVGIKPAIALLFSDRCSIEGVFCSSAPGLELKDRRSAAHTEELCYSCKYLTFFKKKYSCSGTSLIAWLLGTPITAQGSR
jgi:hypothetical protein